MTEFSQHRRRALQTLGLAAGATLLSRPASATNTVLKPRPTFKYALNMSTIRGHKLGFVKELEVAAKAGFTSVEIWIDTFQTYLQNGGSIPEAKKIITGLGLTVENAIGFASWIVDDNATRNAALKQLQTEMDELVQIGCHRIAAPPSGIPAKTRIDLDAVADRYRTILKMGEQTGVIPMVEMWGGSENLSTISQVLYVAAASGDKNALVLLDSFHIYKGGSSVESLNFVGKNAIEVFHVNDYPSGISPQKISEPDRIYTGDGVAPLKQIFEIIKNPDKPVVLSLEVFNESYYKQDPLTVAKTGLAKMKALTAGI